MHHSSPSAITYPSSPQLYYRPLPYSTQPYSPQPYYRPHSPTTRTRPTPHSPTIHLTTLLLHLPYSTLPSSQPYYLHTTYPTTQLSIPDPPTLPMCTLHPIHSCALTCYTYYPAHRTHVPHSTPPCPSPPQMYHAPLYPIASTTQPYLSLLYLPFSSAPFIGLIRPIAPIRPIPTRARTGQVVGVIGLIGAIGLIPP